MAGARIQLKRSTAASWTSNNPVLFVGEIGYETDTKKFKIGDGSTAWTSLTYSSVPLSLSSLNDLGDVTISSAADGDFLRWNGSAWINDAVNLSTDTIGSFVQSLVAGTGVTLANNSGENATPTVAVDTSVIQVRVADVSDTEIGHLNGVTSAIQTQIDAKAPLASPTFTGTVAGITATMVGLGNVNNTSDANKPISTATQTALDLKAPLASPTFTGTVTVPTPVNNTDASTKLYVDSTASTTASNASTALTNHEADTTNIHGIADTSILVTTTGTQTLTNKTITSPAGLVKGDVGLANVDNTSDANKPVSTATQTALDLKANLASPTFTGTVTIPTGASITAPTGLVKGDVGLGNVDNTSDANKPVSTATQTALDLKANLASPTFTGTPTLPTGTIAVTQTAGNNSTAVATTAYVETAVANLVDVAPEALNTLNELAAALGDDANFATTTATNLGLKAPLASPTFTGTVTVPAPVNDTDASTKAYVDSTASTTAGTASTALSNHESDTTNIHGIADTSILVTTTGTQTLTNKTITSPAGLVKGDVGLGNVDNTSDANKPVSTATQTALDLKAPLSSPTFTGTVTVPDNSFALGTKTTGLYIASTDAVDGMHVRYIPFADVASYAGEYNNGASYAIGAIVSTGVGSPYGTSGQLFVRVGNPGNPGYPPGSASWSVYSHETSPSEGCLAVFAVDDTIMQVRVTDVSDTEISYLNGVTSAIQTQIDTKAPIDSPTFTGIVTIPNGASITAPTGLVKGDVGLGNVDNTSDANKPISTATQTALDLKAPLASPTFTGTVTIPTGASITAPTGLLKSDVGLENVDNTSDANKPISTATQTALDLKANLASPTFTGTVTIPTGASITAPTGLVKGDVGLGNVDNTSDANKPVSTATQTALDLKANLASPTFTGTVTVPTPTNSTDAVTKAYADSIAAGINWHGAVELATATVLPNTPTYDNGSSGVGATLTASANARLVVDGVNATTGDRVLVKDQANPVHNGIYVVTEQGSVSLAYVLTRAVDGDGNIDDEVIKGDAVYVDEGATNLNQGFILTSDGTGANDKHIIGTDPLTWTQFTGTANITAGTGITKTGNSLAIGQAVETNSSVTFTQVTAALVGNATTATTLQTARNIAGQSFDGSANISIAPTDLTGVTSTAAEINILDGATLSTAELNFVDGVTSAIQTQLDAKAPLASPTFTGTVSGITSTMVGLGNVDNTSNATERAATATLTNKTLTSPVINTPTGIVKGDVGLGNVDNTSDANKPVSTATQTALDLKANLASPTFTGTVTVPTPTNNTDATTKLYVDTAIAGASISSLDDIGDVTITAAANGDYLKWNGAAFVNDDIDLGTDTVGDYVATITAGTGVTSSAATTGEGTTHTLSIGQAVATTDNVTFAGVTADNIKVGVTGANEIDTVSGDLTIDSFGGTVTIDDNLTVTGNLTVSGTTTSVNTETLTVDDNIIVLNNNATGAPSENAGIEVERGSSTNVALRWNETSDKWEITTDGSTYADIATEAYADAVVTAARIITAAGGDGTAGQALTTNGSGTLDFTTITGTTEASIISAVGGDGSSGQVLKTNGSGDLSFGDVALGTNTTGNYMADVSAGTGISITHTPAEGSTATIALADVSTSAQTASYTLVLADKNKIVEMNVASANNLTVPPNSSVAYPVGSQINILQVGAGQTTVVAGSGVTVNATPGLKMRAQFSYATLIKRGENTWVLVGDISA